MTITASDSTDIPTIILQSTDFDMLQQLPNTSGETSHTPVAPTTYPELHAQLDALAQLEPESDNPYAELRPPEGTRSMARAILEGFEREHVDPDDMYLNATDNATIEMSIEPDDWYGNGDNENSRDRPVLELEIGTNGIAASLRIEGTQESYNGTDPNAVRDMISRLIDWLNHHPAPRSNTA